MAIVWGPWLANDRWRVGLALDYSPKTVTSATSSVTVDYEVWFQVRYASDESGQSGTKWTGGGGISGSSAPFDWSLGAMGTKKIGSGTRTVSLSYGSTTKFSASVSATVAFTYPGTGSTSASVTLPARPYSVPAAPSGVSLVRGSGESLTTSWTRNATTGAPYEWVEIERTNSDAPSGSWWANTRLSGTATSTALQADTDRKYRVRIRAGNSAGVSGWIVSNEVSTTPDAPATPGVTKNSAGDIIVSYAAPKAGSSAAQYEVWHAANGVWDGARLALVTAAAGSYTHVNPDAAQTHAYRLRAVSANPTLYSGYSGTSATVQLQAPPNAPTALSPTGTTLDAAKAVTLTWRHNPVDSTAQSAYEVQHRVNGGAWTLTGKVASIASSRTITAGTWANGASVEWQARTWGADPNPSPWSSTAAFTTSSTPTATINAPDGTTPIDTSKVATTWGYYQAEGKAQAQWQARIKGATGAVLETLSGAGTASSATFKTAVQDAASYTVEVRVQSSVGLWSDWASQGFSVDYAEPPAPVVTAWWQPGDGVVSLDVEQPAPGEGGIEAVMVQVWRAVDGDDWRLIAEVEPGTSVTDFIPALGRINFYRATAVSALPSQADSDVVEVLTSGAKHVFLNAGPGFSSSVRLGSNVKVGIESGREKVLRQFAGRARPVEFAGQGRTRTISLAADIAASWYPAADLIAANSTWEDIDALADLAAPACFRDPEGRRFFVSISPASISGLGTSVLTGVGVTLTEVDWSEPTAAADDA